MNEGSSSFRDELVESFQRLRSQLKQVADSSLHGNPDGATDPLRAFSETAPLRVVQDRFGLSDCESRVLLLCAAAELDGDVSALLGQLQSGVSCLPTFAIASALFPDSSWEILAENRPLRQWSMIEFRLQTDRPLRQCPLRIDEGMLQYLIGNPAPDARLAPYFAGFPVEATVSGLSPRQFAAATEMAATLGHAESLPVVKLIGTSPLARHMTALGIVAALGGSTTKLVRVPAADFPTDPRDADQLARLWAREAILHGLALYLDVDDAAEAPLRLALSRFFIAPETLYLVSSHDPLAGISRASVALVVEDPSTAEREDAWQVSAAGMEIPLESADAAILADQFQVDLPAIFQSVADAGRQKFADSSDLRKHLQAMIRIGRRGPLETLAQRIDPQANMDDLVLPDRAKQQLRDFISHVELRRVVISEWGMGGRGTRGKGTAALFSGESGTGKTLAAEVVAAELGLDLYRIDLSAVVDKYIGETEKNLRRIFDAAEAGGVVLLFDEADALFGKRGEVKDSHDRYANIQINYLLQRLETYRGPAILATNLGRGMDHAFVRRLRFIVRFPQPGRVERQGIWEKCFAPLESGAFPSGDPVLALTPNDFHSISATNLSGGEIRNAAIQAAFLAAATSQPVTRKVVDQAIAEESLKSGRPAPQAINGHHS